MIRVPAIHIVSIIWLTLICRKDKNKSFKYNIKVICIFKGKQIGAIRHFVRWPIRCNHFQLFVYISNISQTTREVLFASLILYLGWIGVTQCINIEIRIVRMVIGTLKDMVCAAHNVLHCDWLQLLQCNVILENFRGIIIESIAKEFDCAFSTLITLFCDHLKYMLSFFVKPW